MPNAHMITVMQGEFKVSVQKDEVLSTILGSCIATCIWDPVACVGGMNHFLLPGNAGEKAGNLSYGVNAMELLINAVLQLGAQRNRLQCKLFGGASMFETCSGVGKKNSEFAFWFLRNEDLAVVSHNVGGNRGRKIRFWPCDGRAQMMLLEDAWQEPASQAAVPKPVPPVGGVTLF
ncbi:MAG: chemotaxis protein CheD [Rhodobacterales bacterium]|nr:MAG: chemotaxis protein CheD [Rhodobacterales bacterium]